MNILIRISKYHFLHLGFLLMFFAQFFGHQLQQPIDLEIWEIQGSGNVSPYLGEFITTENNIVTVVSGDLFYMQSTITNTDNNPDTSDGIAVYTSGDFSVQVGDIVKVEGYVDEFNDVTTIDDNGLEVSVQSSNNALPAPILFDAEFPSKIPAQVHDLESAEGMHVELVNALVTAATSEYDFVYVTSGERPFRESGINYPGQSNLPVFDRNPELFQLEIFGQSTPIVAAGARVNATGVLLQNYYEDYVFYATDADFFGNGTIIDARPRNGDELSIGCINALFLDADANRVQKMADYIIDKMKTPDIISFQEVLGLNVLENIADRVEAAEPSIQYNAHLVSSGSISLGYLVRNTLSNVVTNQLGTTEVLSTTGWTLHNRPPYLLEAKINTPVPTPISILNVHIRSLNGINGNDANFVRTKRHEQAVSIANMVKDRLNNNLFVMGDFNAFQFSDGYVDVVNQIQGTPSEGAIFEQVPVLEEPMINLTTDFVEPDQQYSYVYQGNAQILDHCLAVPELNELSVNEVIYIRNNADFYDGYLENFNTTLRVSDHDGFVIYLQLQDTVSAIEPEPQPTANAISYPNPISHNDNITLTLLTPGFLSVKLYSTDGKLMMHRNFGFFQGGNLQVATNFGVASGVYFMEVESTDFYHSDKVLVLTE